ncbi:hypothetical protein Tco_1415946 [Tanacetum coccineum]
MFQQHQDGNLREFSGDEAWEAIDSFAKAKKTWDKVDNPCPQSTLQVLLSFEVYTSPVIHPKEVEETIGIPMEVEPLDHMNVEDLGLNTNTHDLFLGYKGFPSVNELEP